MEAPRTRHWARRPRWLTRSSPIQISPASGGSSSPIRLRSVDLPEPEVPETATSSPPFTSRSTPWSTGTGMPPGPVKVLRSPLAFSSMLGFSQPSPQGFALQLELPRLRDPFSSRLATARGRRSARTAGPVSARTSAAPPDGFGGRKPRDAKGGVGGGEPAQHDREDDGKCQETRREEEELLSLADDPRIDGGADAEGQEHAHHAARQADAERLAEHFAKEMKVGGAQRALDSEVANALEDGRRHGIGQRQAADEKSQHADAQEKGGEERRRLAQEAADLAGNGDVDLGHRRLDASRHGVGILAVLPPHRRPCVEVVAPQAARAEGLDEEGVAAQPEIARIVDPHEGEP